MGRRDDVRQFCRLRDIEFIEVNVQQVKATGAHKGNSLGRAVACQIAGGHFNCAGKYHGDEADAIGVGLAVHKKLMLERMESEG